MDVGGAATHTDRKTGGIFPTGNHSYLAGPKQKPTKESLWEQISEDSSFHDGVLRQKLHRGIEDIQKQMKFNENAMLRNCSFSTHFLTCHFH